MVTVPVGPESGPRTSARPLDECILQYIRVSASGSRHISVTTDNDVSVSGWGSTNQGVST